LLASEHLVVCDPRKNALMRDGNQNDRVDARNLAELLFTRYGYEAWLKKPHFAALGKATVHGASASAG